MAERLPPGPITLPPNRPPPIDEVDFLIEEPIPDNARIQEVTAQVRELPGEAFYDPVKMRYETGVYNKAGYFSCEAVPRGDVSPPSDDNEIFVRINGEHIYRGWVSNSYQLDNGLVYIESYDTIRRLQRADFHKTYRSARPEKIAIDICKRAGAPYEKDKIGFDIPPQLRPNDRAAVLENIEFDGSCLKCLDQLSRLLNSIWFVDKTNEVNFTNDFEPTIHKDIELLKHDAGKQSIPFEKIVVIGEPLSRPSVYGGAGPPENVRVKASAGKGKPVYKQKYNNIHKESIAKTVAEGILREFRKQRADGEVKLVGNPTIRPLDVIQLPEKFGDEIQYGVASVTQEIVNNEYTTQIKCNGLI